MAYREVTMVEIKEVLRLWFAGGTRKGIARQLGLDPKTVRRYVRAAARAGVERGGSGPSDEQVAAVMVALRAPRPRDHGEAWARCVAERPFLEEMLKRDVRLSKVRRLLRRRGVEIPYSTLHRYAVEELAFGRSAPTIPVADGEPGVELQLDVGWVLALEPDEHGRRRRVRAWIFAPSVSRYRFVYPCSRETTESAIEACEAAWEFYGGVFHVLVVDNTKAIVQTADGIAPRINVAFLEYAQARGFTVDPARARHPKDKARVERSVRDVRDDCFGGEAIRSIEEGRSHARRWCADEYGMRRHSTTLRLPREHFEADEKAHLVPPPALPYDIPSWSEPKVSRDQHAQVAKGLYPLARKYVGRRLVARADRHTVRFYEDGVLVRTFERVLPGRRASDLSVFPPEKSAAARRDVAFFVRQAQSHGAAVGRYAQAILEGPRPWGRMRQVWALLGLVRRYGSDRVREACDRALATGMVDVKRLGRMLEAAAPTPVGSPPRVLPMARFLREPRTYALLPAPPAPDAATHKEKDR